MTLVRTLLLVAALLEPAFALLPSVPLEQYGRQSWQTGSGLPQNTVTALAQTTDGFLWIGTEAGLARFDGYSFFLPPELQHESISGLASQGTRVIVGTQSGVFASKDGHFVRSADSPPEPVRRIVDRHGTVWIGTDHGLKRPRAGALETFPGADSLSGAEILALLEDAQGNLWAGTSDSGLQLIKDQRFITSTNSRIHAVLQHGETAWFGTDASGVLRFEFGSTTAEKDGGAEKVLSLAYGDAGLIIGTNAGVRIPGSRQLLSTADGLPAAEINALLADNDGTIWAGTPKGLAHIVNGTVTNFTQANGLGSDSVEAVMRDRQGTLWVATRHGLSRWNGSMFANYTVADGLPSNIIHDLYADEAGYLWIATEGGGVSRFRDELFTSVTKSPATIFGVADDGVGNLWLASPTGVYRVNKTTFAQQGFGVSDGLRTPECSRDGHPAVWKNADGGLWFATARGASFLSPQHAAMRDPAPLTGIESASVDDEAVDLAPGFEVPAGRSRIAFQYAGVDFQDPRRVRYQYRLTGFDRDWINAGSRRTAYYTNLGPGVYTFQVRATNHDRDWPSTYASLNFRVLPHFYQTWWFRSVLLGCAVGLIYGIVRWRERTVQRELNAVHDERTRIAREIHDTLAQGFAGISVQLELVSRLLNKPEKARSHLDQARSLARSCLDDARRTIWDLRNSESEELPTRLSKVARDAAQASGIAVQFHVRGTYRALQPKTEDEIVRIAQEAIANAVRHSEASAIDTNLVFDGSAVRLTVSDNGRGMRSVEPVDGHYGLTGMRERARNIGGELQVASRPGEGTTVSLEASIR